MLDPCANGHGQTSEEVRPADDPADAATLAALRRLAAVPPPRPMFARSLKANLMDVPTTHAIPLSPVEPWSGSRSALPIGAPVDAALRLRELNALATAVLLLVTSATIYLAVVGWNDGDGRTPTVPAFAAATPHDATYVSEACRSFFSCPNSINMTWTGFADVQGVDLASLGVRDVQLQGWTLDPGATLARPAAAAGDPQGVVVDFVTSGVYQATFDVPVEVTHLGGAGNTLVESFDPGMPVELSHGESVSYQLGGLADLRNPLRQRHAHFKRAVFYMGDVTATHVTGVTGVAMRVDGDGQLRQALGIEYGISLVYVTISPGLAFPPEAWKDTVIIGPVSAEAAPEESQGYVLQVGLPRG